MDPKKIYLNIQEQVEKNKNDILDIMQGATVLAEFGIKVIGQVDDASELPDPTTYLEEEGTAYGDAYAVGTEAPYDFYIFTRAFEGQTEPSWFNIGEFPVPGPEGPAGQDGATGPAGRGIQSIAKVSTSGLEDTYQITYTDGSFVTYVIKNGADGQAAAITGATANVDDGQGTPSVELNVGGTSTSRTFEFIFHNLKGPTGPQGDPGAFFVIAGQVASESLLPAASEVATTQAYLVGGAPPYNVYAIMVVNEVHEWINLGPVATQESDTKVGSSTFSASGTLPAEVLAELVNTATADFLKIGDRYFVKQSTGHYYALKRDSGQMLVYALDIDLSTGVWTITTETMFDLDTDQTVNTDKTIAANKLLKFLGSSYNVLIGNDGSTLAFYINSTSNKRLKIGNARVSPGSDNAYDLGESGAAFKDFYLKGKAYLPLIYPDSNDQYTYINKTQGSLFLSSISGDVKTNSNFVPNSNDSKNLGNSSYKWKDIYLSGKFKDGNNTNFGLKLPNTASWDADRTIATTDDIPVPRHLYRHVIKFSFSQVPYKNDTIGGEAELILYTSTNAAFNVSTLKSYISQSEKLCLSGYVEWDQSSYVFAKFDWIRVSSSKLQIVAYYEDEFVELTEDDYTLTDTPYTVF